MEIKDYIRSFEDFPVKGVSFKDTAGLCSSHGFQLANKDNYTDHLPFLLVQ